MKYDLGDSVRLSVVFTNAISGEHTDPSTLTLTLQLPDGSTDTTIPVAQAATGKYYADYVTTVSGVHLYRWAGTGTCQAAAEGAFTVSRSLLSV